MDQTISLFYILLIALVEICLSDETIDLKLKQGDVIGKIETTVFKNKDYFAFRGIPFGEPPVNELRFLPPVPHRGWNGTLETLENKPTCMQFSARMRNNEPFGISGSEDCLYINVFTQNLKGNAPVIVFDYNDNFKTGFNWTDTYSPEQFIDEDVIVVMISHRLGMFGYLTTEDEVIPGNNGLRDFILGLQWVKDNIQDFGGDPDKVTLMGSCGGAALVNLLLYSEKAKGLFSGAIIQSGNAFETSYFHQNTRELTFIFGQKLNINTSDSAELLEGLQKIDAEKLLADIVLVLVEDDLAKKTQLSVHLFTPIIEITKDAVLTHYPEEGKVINDVPIIIGYNSREGLDFVAHFLMDPNMLTPQAEDNLLSLPVRTGYRFEKGSKIYKEANKEIIDHYFETKNLDYNTVLEYANYAGDLMEGYPTKVAVENLSTNIKSPLFFYLFDFRGQLNENMQFLARFSRYNLGHYGATVADELCYLHVCSRIRRDYENLKKMISEQKEMKVLKRMVRMWSNFAKFRNPTPITDDVLNGFSWEPVGNNSDLNYLHITKTLRMATNPLGDNGKFWDNFLKKYGEMAVDGVVKDKEHDEL